MPFHKIIFDDFPDDHRGNIYTAFIDICEFDWYKHMAMLSPQMKIIKQLFFDNNNYVTMHSHLIHLRL